MLNDTIQRLSTTETAKLVRQALQQAFPGGKFSVKSKRYTGGSSIDVRWTDGPAKREVEPYLKQFEGADFDGMSDMKVYTQAWMLPDGTAQLAYRPDGGGSVPEVVTDAPHPDATLIRFGVDFIFGHRDVSYFDARYEVALEMIRQRCAVEEVNGVERFASRWVTDLARAMVFDQSEGEHMDLAFRRVVLLERL